MINVISPAENDISFKSMKSSHCHENLQNHIILSNSLINSKNDQHLNQIISQEEVEIQQSSKNFRANFRQGKSILNQANQTHYSLSTIKSVNPMKRVKLNDSDSKLQDGLFVNFGSVQSIEKVLVFSEDKKIKHQFGNTLIKIENNSKLSNNYLNQTVSNLLQDKFQFWPMITTNSQNISDFIEQLKESKNSQKYKKWNSTEFQTFEKLQLQASNPKTFTEFNKTDLLNDQDKIQLINAMSMCSSEVTISYESMQLFTIMMGNLSIGTLIDSFFVYLLKKRFT